MVSDQMCEYFGIRRRLKGMPGIHETLFQMLEILNYSVMDQGDAAGLVLVRMRIFVGRWTVSRPACMPYSQASRERLRLHENSKTFVDLALLLVQLQFSIVDDRDPSAIIAAVFKPAQPFQ